MKRVRYFDLLRVVCFCMIIWYHMLVELCNDGMLALEDVSPWFANANIHIGTLSVAVFFMLSGASLTISTRGQIHYKQFYVKRGLRLLVPFYFVNICCFIIRMIQVKSFSLLITGTAPWKIFLGITGIDAWLGLYGVSSFSQGIGEWFLGCLVILYAVFPLLRKLMNKNETVFLAVVASIYIVMIYHYLSPVPVHQNILVKGCEFVFGMYLGKYWEKLDKKILIVSLPAVMFCFTSSTPLVINDGLKITISALVFFVTFSFAENILQKSTCVYPVIRFLSGCSYELFLVHHIVIISLTSAAGRFICNKMNLWILFIAELAAMAAFTALVKVSCDYCILRMKRIFGING